MPCRGGRGRFALSSGPKMLVRNFNQIAQLPDPRAATSRLHLSQTEASPAQPPGVSHVLQARARGAGKFRSRKLVLYPASVHIQFDSCSDSGDQDRPVDCRVELAGKEPFVRLR